MYRRYKVKKGVLIATLVAILLVINYQIVQKEILLRDGRGVIVKLAPVDPRSIMQGDFMRLRFDVGRKIYQTYYVSDLKKKRQSKYVRGVVVLKLDERGVGRFDRLYDGENMSDDEVAIKFKITRYNRVSFGSSNFFFEEGSGKKYQKAKYALLKVKDREVIITNLLDENLKKIE